MAEGKSDGVKERERQLAAARAEIEQEAHRAREELRGQVSAIAMAGAEKILNREIDTRAHEDILGKYRDAGVIHLYLGAEGSTDEMLSSLNKGTDVDQPRNLAKSVTVE